MSDKRSDTAEEHRPAEGPSLRPGEIAPGTSRTEFEARHPEDPASAPGWREYVKDFFDREVFPGEKIRKATDAMRDGQIEGEPSGPDPDRPDSSKATPGDEREGSPASKRS